MLGYLEDYNDLNSTQMNLVLFQFAIQHIARICRVIKQPGGNVLLVGVGGSGKQSLARLAAFIEGFDVYQVPLGLLLVGSIKVKLFSFSTMFAAIFKLENLRFELSSIAAIIMGERDLNLILNLMCSKPFSKKDHSF